jgi:hypothetical protein
MYSALQSPEYVQKQLRQTWLSVLGNERADIKKTETDFRTFLQAGIFNAERILMQATLRER